jgi:hypothetical protein
VPGENNDPTQEGDFSGAVQCSQGDTQSSASSMTGSSQDRDSDSDGIPDSSDNCANNSTQGALKKPDSTVVVVFMATGAMCNSLII